MKMYLLNRDDGGVEIMQIFPVTRKKLVLLAERDPLELSEDDDAFESVYPTIDEILAKWHPNHLEQIISYREITAADVPADRTFRDAWTDSGSGITHDMSKCREITQRMLRFSGGDEMNRAIAAARTPEELKVLASAERR